MSSLAPFLTHGRSEFPRDLPRLTLRPNGLDTATQQWLSPNALAFAKGGRFPGLPNFYITESEPALEPTGVPSEIRLRGEGLADGQDRQEDSEITVTDEGWDQGPMTWLTLHPERYQRGAAHPHHPTLWMLEVSKKRLAGPRNSLEGVWRISGDHKGILPQDNGLPKGRKRRITVGNQVYTSGSPIALGPTFTDENGNVTGWSTGRLTNLDLSTVQVSDTFLSWDRPPTDGIPGHLTPENAPPIKDIFSNTAWTAGTVFVYNWPYGWTLKSVNAEPLIEGMVGTPWLVTLVTEFKQIAFPKG